MLFVKLQLKTTSTVWCNCFDSYWGAESFTHHCSSTISATLTWQVKHEIYLCYYQNSIDLVDNLKVSGTPKSPWTALWRTLMYRIPLSKFILFCLILEHPTPSPPTAFKSPNYRIQSHNCVVRMSTCRLKWRWFVLIKMSLVICLMMVLKCCGRNWCLVDT